MIQSFKNRILVGERLSDDEIYQLSELTDPENGAPEEVRHELRDASAELTRAIHLPHFESCSIVNARSGRCSENCKWCAQSSHFNTGCETYDIVDDKDCMEAARTNARGGVARFSLVASGRAVKGKSLDKICTLLEQANNETGIMTCASLGLIGKEEAEKLRRAGVTRYHCNLETAPSHFPTLCSSHTIEDKITAIKAARDAGLDICSGGIIGMGESRRQRAEFALTLRRVAPCSIPLNILQPIPGTPLEDIALISFDDILDSIAIFRFAHPATELRFAGGRSRFSREEQLEMLRVGINGGIVGTLLTTTASQAEADRNLAREAGLTF